MMSSLLFFYVFNSLRNLFIGPRRPQQHRPLCLNDKLGEGGGVHYKASTPVQSVLKLSM